MKIRDDFITNSSSTNFIFAFRGKTKNDLFKHILDREERFFLYRTISDITGKDKEISCRAIDIINEMKNYAKKVKVVEILDYIKNLKKMVKQYEKEIIKERYVSDCYVRGIYELISQIATLEYAKKLGINKVLEIEFGDNSGLISGTDVAILMDYEGRYIDIRCKDLVVITEQRR